MRLDREPANEGGGSACVLTPVLDLLLCHGAQRFARIDPDGVFENLRLVRAQGVRQIPLRDPGGFAVKLQRST